MARLAAAQFGVFAREQVARLGATRGVIDHRIRAGRWERLGRDVFRLAGDPSSWRQPLMAACLAWGPGSVVSHRAAAALWRLAGFDPGPVELTLPLYRRRDGPGIIHHNLLQAVDVTTVELIPVTTPARTLIDVASVSPREVVEEALDDALRRGIVSIPRLRWRLAELARRGRTGVAVMRDLIEVRDPTSVPQSVFETRLLRAMRRAGLPPPEAQHPIRSDGRLVGIVDFAFPDARLAIEADGYRWHSGRARWEGDRTRRNELTLLGWRVIHVTWADLSQRQEAVIDTIKRVLAGAP
ncbi:MAG: type IV toxin-antitoxin system AbiEi family antitoxin domain-containing protein [Acidobacteria bacterium]|nr:type IV toxin-antitoxin system AbiEi family antitoxin domain-containing protein [Acidobacteriota bacterium]